jgi:hypothetical protein
MLPKRTCYTDKQFIAAKMFSEGPLYGQRIASNEEFFALIYIEDACPLQPLRPCQ